MIIVGKRQSGKSYYAMKQIIKRYKEGDIIGVIGFNLSNSHRIKNELTKKFKDIGLTPIIKVINLTEIYSVDHVLIDDLELVLGEKCVCSATNDIVNIISDNSIENENAYKEVKPSIDYPTPKLSKELYLLSDINDSYEELLKKSDTLESLAKAFREFAESKKNLEAKLGGK